MAKLSGAAVLLLVVVPLCMYTCALLVGIQLGRAVERGAAESLGDHPVRTLVQRIPDCVGGVRCTLRGAIDYVTKELLWDTNVLGPRRRREDGGNSFVNLNDDRVREVAVPVVVPSSRSSGVERSSSSEKQPYRDAIPLSWVDDALPKTKSTAKNATIPISIQRYYSNHTSPKGVISVGPWGGFGGQSFYMHGTSAPRLRSIIIYHSSAIHSLACEYTLADGYYRDARMMQNRVAGPWGLPQSYGSIGVRAKIDLPSGEHITAVEGTTGHFANVPGAVITSLTFRTSSGRTYGPYGGSVAAGSSHYFSVPAADGACMVGFWGRAGWLVDAIGVYMKPSCSSSSDTAYNKKYYASRRPGRN